MSVSGANVPETAENPAASIEVIVKQMPEAPSKPLFKDSTRLLSVAAFIFSVSTGMYAAISSRNQHIDSEVEGVGKLISEYYSKAEKIRTVRRYGEEAYYFNMLRSQQRSDAARAVRKALAVRRHIDNGIWMSLAQMNMFEGNWAAAEDAWISALANEPDIGERIFILRNVAKNEAFLQRMPEAEQRLDLALKLTAESGDVLGPQEKASETVAIHGTWLELHPKAACVEWNSHLNQATKLIDEIFRGVSANIPEVQKDRTSLKDSLDEFTASRGDCK